jgi:Uma2 family endonuclease
MRSMAAEVSRWRFTVDDYQEMARTHILPDDGRTELIDGEILKMSPVGVRHNAAMARGNRALVRAVGESAIVLPQGSVRLDLFHMPEPDFALLRAKADFYLSDHARPPDILLLIEIADSSITYDRDVKALIYARLGIAEYWIADLNEDVLSCCAEPRDGRYREVVQRRPGERVSPRLLPDCAIDVDDLLAT